MKKFLISVIVIFSTVNVWSQSHESKQIKHQKKGIKNHLSVTATPPADDSANYIGTNDFNLALVREGVKKA